MPVLLFIVCINFIGIGALIPILPYTVIETLGLPASVMTLLLASFAFAMFVANPILGRLSDFYGRRRVLLVSLGLNCAAHFWFAFSDDIVEMFVARLIAGFASGNTGVIQAMIADRTTSEKRAQYMGLLGAAIGVGFVAGPALGGFLSGFGSGPLHQAPFLMASGFAFFALLMTFRLQGAGKITATAQTGAETRPAFLTRIANLMKSPLALYAIGALALNLSFAQVEASFVLVLRDYLAFGARETGWLFTYIGVCIVIVQAVLIKHVVGQFGETGTLFFGAVLLAIGQLITVIAVLGWLIGSDYPLAQTMVATTAICFGFAFCTPALSAAVSKLAGQSVMGGALGMIQGFGSLGQVIGLSIAGPLYELGGSQYPFGVGALVTLILVLMVPFLTRPPRATPPLT